MSRIERGETFPSASIVERLDALYAQSGDLIHRRLLLLAADRPRLEESPWRTRWVHHYPAGYAGEVFLRLTVAPERRPVRVRIAITWGPWRLRRHVALHDERGVALALTKGADGLSLPLVVETDVPTAASFAVGTPPRDAININSGWERIDDSK